MKEIEKWIENNLHDNWVLLGLYYGYPKCCIKAFCTLPAFMDKINKKLRLSKVNGEGFVPCAECAKSDKSLEELIENRQCPTKFPISDINSLEEIKIKIKQLRHEKSIS